MTRAQADLYAAKRDLWLCLARAFAAPGSGAFLAAFVQDLPCDLDAIALETGLQMASDLEEFAAAAKALPDALEIERLYAALFMTPPAPVFLNTAIYLDGAFLGESELAIHDWYARHGFARHEGFHDLNDHAAVQLEFVGLLYDRASGRAAAGDDMAGLAYASEAQRFLAAYPKRWITPFLQGLQRACAERGLNGAYVHLARILWRAIETELTNSTIRLEAGLHTALPQGSSRGIGDLTAEDLAEIAVRLKFAGLDFGHVRQRPEWREEVFEVRLADAGARTTC